MLDVIPPLPPIEEVVELEDSGEPHGWRWIMIMSKGVYTHVHGSTFRTHHDFHNGVAVKLLYFYEQPVMFVEFNRLLVKMWNYAINVAKID